MKIFKILVAILFPLLLLAGCVDPAMPQEVYHIGQEYTFGAAKVKLDLDAENEQFILYYNVPKEDTEIKFFSFTFSKSAVESLRNSDQFEYHDNLGSQIVFDDYIEEGIDEYKCFRFYGSRIFYISYRNADDDIKQLIENRDKGCSISSLVGTFIFFD